MTNQDDKVFTSVKRPRYKRATGWLKVITSIYCLIGIAIYYLQDALLLHPIAISRNQKYSFTMPFREVNIAYDKDININLIQFNHSGSAYKGIILYFHGNRNNVQRYAGFAPALTRHGYEVWMVDYPGFGKSTGKFSEQMVYDWSLVVYNLARKKAAPDRIVIYGKSLGTGIAAQLASIRDCRRLILETPYYSLISLSNTYFWMYPTKWMIHYKLPTHTWLQKVTAPVSFFHGTNDRVIPYDNAKRLLENLKSGDEFTTIPQGSHNDLYEHAEMRRKMDSLLNL